MDWYKQWFGEEYLLVYEHRNIREAEHDVQHIKHILNLKHDEFILDLCCGTGRHDPQGISCYRLGLLDADAQDSQG